MCAIQLNFCVKVNAILVPYMVSVHGMHFNDSENASSVSNLFIKAITCNEKRFQQDEKELLTPAIS